MPKSKPESEEEVFNVMKSYCQKKGYLFTNAQLRFMAENCYLLYESKGWQGVKYWPPLAMKWCLNNLERSYKAQLGKHYNPKPKVSKGKSVRDVIMEKENTEQENND